MGLIIAAFKTVICFKLFFLCDIAHFEVKSNEVMSSHNWLLINQCNNSGQAS